MINMDKGKDQQTSTSSLPFSSNSPSTKVYTEFVSFNENALNNIKHDSAGLNKNSIHQNGSHSGTLYKVGTSSDPAHTSSQTTRDQNVYTFKTKLSGNMIGCVNVKNIQSLSYVDSLPTNRDGDLHQVCQQLLEHEMKCIEKEVVEEYFQKQKQGFDGTKINNTKNNKKLTIKEIQNLIKKKYLAHMPLPVTTHLDNLETPVGAQLAKYAEGEHVTGVDFNKYKDIDPPKDKDKNISNDCEDWKETIKKLQQLYEYSSNSSLNLELMIKFSRPVWTRYLQSAQNLLNSLQKETDTAKEKNDIVNRERKLEQLNASDELKSNQESFKNFLKKNEDILVAINELSSDVETLKRKCREQGILPVEYEDSDEDELVESWKSVVRSYELQKKKKKKSSPAPQQTNIDEDIKLHRDDNDEDQVLEESDSDEPSSNDHIISDDEVVDYFDE